MRSESAVRFDHLIAKMRLNRIVIGDPVRPISVRVRDFWRNGRMHPGSIFTFYYERVLKSNVKGNSLLVRSSATAIGPGVWPNLKNLSIRRPSAS